MPNLPRRPGRSNVNCRCLVGAPISRVAPTIWAGRMIGFKLMNPLIGDGDAFTPFVVCFPNSWTIINRFQAQIVFVPGYLHSSGGSGKNVVLLFSSSVTIDEDLPHQNLYRMNTQMCLFLATPCAYSMRTCHQLLRSSTGCLAAIFYFVISSGKNVVLIFSSGLTVLDSELNKMIISRLMANLQSDRICGRIFIKLPPN